MKQIATCLWFDGQAQQAAEFYCSVFPHSAITSVQRYPGKEDVLYVEFTLDGRDFAGLNGGPQFPHSEAISLVVPVESSEENDRYYAALVEGGSEQPCGWLKDRFGVSWQIVPVEADAWMRDPDPEKAGRTVDAMMQMHGKLDIEVLRKAYLG
jgi:predicted 3-demethylubiquinone-9 3-methyltransferase (glyoxalase superfamily)